MKHLVGFQCGSNKLCIFCGRGNDSIKHFAHCDVIEAFFDMNFVVCKHLQKLVWFLMLDSNATDVALRAKLLAAVHASRMIAYTSPQHDMPGLLQQMAKHYGVTRQPRAFKLKVDDEGVPIGLFDEINCL